MRLKYYGTGAAEGVPALFCRCEICQEARRRRGKDIRTRAQATVDDALLIDFGPDTFLHTISGGLPLANLRACVVTHPHEDHLCLDEVGYRARGYASNVVPGPFRFYGSDSVCRALDGLADWGRDAERIAWTRVEPFETFEAEGYGVTALPAAHGIGENPPMRCFIYAIEKDDRRLLYAHDTGIMPEETWAWLAGRRFDLVSLDCTMQKRSGGRNHMGIDDVLKTKARLCALGCGSPRTAWVVSHFSHNGGLLHSEMEDALRRHDIAVAFDGLTVEV